MGLGTIDMYEADLQVPLLEATRYIIRVHAIYVDVDKEIAVEI